MNIQQLRYVVATAERGSMTAAAASLYVAQPARAGPSGFSSASSR